MKSPLLILCIIAILITGLITCTQLPNEADFAPVKFKPVITSALQPAMRVTQGQTAMLGVTIKGSDTIAYVWYKNGVQIADSIRDSLTLRNVYFSDAGTYKVIASNRHGSDSSKIVLSVDSLFYTITISQTGKGTISPAGTNGIIKVRPLETPVFTYTPDSGSQVDSVIVNGTHISAASTSTQYTFPSVYTNGSFRVVFGGTSYKLEITTPVNGTITPNQLPATFAYGDTITLTAVPNTGYYFGGWGGDTSGINPVLHLTMKSDKRISANFVDNSKLSLTVTASHGRVTLDPAGGAYTKDTPVKLKAIADTGYRFTAWSDGASGTSDTVTVVMTAKKTVTATFSPITYRLSLSASTGGTVTTPSTDTVSAEYGVPVTITATAKTGYSFVRWTVDSGNVAIADTVNPSTSVTLKAGNAKIRAVFVLKNYTLTTGSTNSADTVSPSKDTLVPHGVPMPIQVRPVRGTHFIKWTTIVGTASFADSSKAVTTVTLSTENSTIRAITAIDSCTLALTKLNGTVTVSPDKAAYLYGDTVRLVATPASGYRFSGWSGDTAITDTLQTSIKITFVKNRTIIANFTVIGNYSLNVTADGGRVTKNPDNASYTQGTKVVLTAIPDSVHLFDRWTGDATGAANPCTVTVSGNKAVTANFTQLYTVAYMGNLSESGSVPVNTKKYKTGDTVMVPGAGTLVRAGYSFAGWTVDAGGSGTVYSAGVPLTQPTFTIGTSNVVFFVRWWAIEYMVTFNRNGGISEAIPSGMYVKYNATIGTLPTPPTRTGYTFAGWNTDVGGSGTAFTSSNIISANMTVYAQWTAIQYTVFFEKNGGNVDANPTFKTALIDGNVGTLPNAPSREGYNFTNWNTASNGTGTVFTAGTAVSGHLTVYAQWTINQYTVTYNENNGSGTVPGVVTHDFQTSVTVAGQGSLSRSGYLFAGWNRFSNGSGTSYAAGSSINFGAANVTLYAKWASLTDIDGNVYTAVTIGTQTWMVENLKTTKYNDGTTIPLVTDSATWTTLTTPGYCWYNNDAAANKATYGALYNWYVVNTGKLAPMGWHVSTDTEWTTLTTYLGGETVAGGKLKEAGETHWASPNTGATNETGFTAFPGGYRDINGKFKDFGGYGYWWSSTAYNATFALGRIMDYNDAKVNRGGLINQSGFSVRCVLD